MRRVCISIGVSRAEGLAPLRAAAIAAEEVGQWAELSGFAKKEDIAVLTDREDPVTIDLIGETIERLLPMGTRTDALLLHFAGHGLREDSTRTLWLPTDWRTRLRAIAVERLKNRLAQYGVGNVTIISDACKALANDRDTSDLTPDGVLGSGPAANSRPILDRFDAVHDVETAFMIPGETPARSRCLFSGALMEGLWGETRAIDPTLPGKVTPGSLADFLEKRVAELCATYKLSCDPELLAGRPADHLIYFDEEVVVARVELPPWPDPDALQMATARLAPEPEPAPVNPTEAPAKKAARPPRAGGPPDTARSILGRRLGSNNPDITKQDREAALPQATEKVLATWVKRIERATKGPERATRAELQWLRATARGEVERSLVEERRRSARRSIASALTQPLPDPARANLLIDGGTTKSIWSRSPVERVGENEWRVRSPEGAAEQLLIEFGDGVFVPVVIYGTLSTVVARDKQGRVNWLLRSEHEPADQGLKSSDILARLSASELPPSEIDKVAALYRRGKHGNPVIGAVCSYLYDYIGDLDSIRRMAFFYVEHAQPIPYDIALMGELATRHYEHGYRADVPAVAERPRGEDKGLPSYVVNATPATEGAVAGRCPWLRQGWDFVEEPTDREAPLVQALPPVREHLLAETFTAFSRTGGRMLASAWQLERWK